LQNIKHLGNIFLVRYTYKSYGPEDTKKLAAQIGANIKGGEVFQLVSDLGGGKTVFVAGLAQGFGSKDPVSSPSFTINNVYRNSAGKSFHHFDFYRLNDPGIIKSELEEVVSDSEDVIALEWSGIVEDILPQNTVKVKIEKIDEMSRSITISSQDYQEYLLKDVA
jgi:tRNA threonylcarbamoyladenosine biosynthesis protein TsaE